MPQKLERYSSEEHIMSGRLAFVSSNIKMFPYFSQVPVTDGIYSNRLGGVGPA